MTKEEYITKTLEKFPQWEALRTDISQIISDTWDEAYQETIEIKAEMKKGSGSSPLQSEGEEFFRMKIGQALLEQASSLPGFVSITDTPDSIIASITIVVPPESSESALQAPPGS